MDAVIERAMELASQISFKNISSFAPLFRQIVMYGMIGSFSAGLDSVAFIGLRAIKVNLFAANFAGINLGILSSFLLNTFLNFRVKDKIKMRMMKFYTVGYAGLFLSMIVMHIGANIFGIKELLVKITSIFIVAAFQFILNKLFTFKINRRNDG
jgi:putative flippase GtrA